MVTQKAWIKSIPTKTSRISKYEGSNRWVFTSDYEHTSSRDSDAKPQHLYITNAEPILIGDYAISNGKIMRIHPEWSWAKGNSVYRKVIASTDKLVIGDNKYLPFLDINLILRFCETQVKEVLVKYEVQVNDGEWKDELDFFELGVIHKSRPKVDKNNVLDVDYMTKDEKLKDFIEGLNYSGSDSGLDGFNYAKTSILNYINEN